MSFGFILAAPTVVSAASLQPPVTFAADDCQDVDPDNSTGELKKAREGANYGLNCLSKKYLQPAIAFMSAVAGLAVAISIVLGGIQYSSAGGDPGKVAAARDRIRNAIFALLAFLFLYAFLNWLLPGGIGN